MWQLSLEKGKTERNDLMESKSDEGITWDT